MNEIKAIKLLKAGEPTSTQKIFSKSLLQRLICEFIHHQKGMMFGEINPVDSNINIDNIIYRIENLYLDEDDVLLMDIKLLNKGVSEGFDISKVTRFGLRGIGTADSNGEHLVINEEDYILISIDAYIE